ncbi:MAG: hypothetical protein H6868_05695 [Rhodospirillales bacterium]|nr:hypothetical protein [Rhodospirillales bacterium]
MERKNQELSWQGKEMLLRLHFGPVSMQTNDSGYVTANLGPDITLLRDADKVPFRPMAQAVTGPDAVSQLFGICTAEGVTVRRQQHKDWAPVPKKFDRKRQDFVIVG